MSEFKKRRETEGFRNEDIGFSFTDVKKVADTSIVKIKQEVNVDASEIAEEIDTSLVRIKTEPNLTTNCDIVSPAVNFMHQEVDSFETSLTAIKEEFNSDTDIINNNITVHLLIPETILTEKADVDIQVNSAENLHANHSSVDSELTTTPTMLTETREESGHSSGSSNFIHEKTSMQNTPYESTKRQSKKRKYSTEFLTLESFKRQLSTTGSSEMVMEAQEPGKKLVATKKASVKTKMSDKTPNEVSVSDIEVIDPESSVLPTSTTGSNKVNIKPQQPRKRGRKSGSKTTPQATKKEQVVCPFCDKKMAKNYFPYHARVHTDEKPFKCSKCPYTSHFKGPLAFHIESHHPTEGFIKPKQ